ncbi:hypothetical protein IC235_19875 [Hymenobacter sp. BT664]|uniref:SH3 domain-containing protein n=1 Tax=Hymenobacter montanus TaxID=2771359 RepID=A0A927BFX9_9BACT|nr:hypothetical protein [Hymenobacter montanus]MBD2770152.1 hypothetical protein [Hymenobacter montanus]
MPTLYQVLPLEANVRAQPKLAPRNIIAQLKQGQLVEELPALPNQPAGWRRVRASVQGAAVEGYLKAFLLAKSAAPPVPDPPVALPSLPEAHLSTKAAVRITNPDLRAFSLNDPAQPRRVGTSVEARVRELAAIIAYLRVEAAARYQRTASATFCNIYAHDYCHLADVYLPRVWWRAKALTQLVQGQRLPASYGTTVEEYNVNSLYNWLEEFGTDFGWRRTTSLTELQQAANLGQVGIICAQRTNLNAPGHIVAVVPETESHKASRQGGQVSVPLQSQAGAINFRYGGRGWWTGAQFRRFGFWIHA